MFKKLFAIEYHNKNFMVFMDENQRKTFLEINQKGEYEYPLLEDFIALNKMYNFSDKTIVYAPKYTYKEKVRMLKGGVSSLLVVVSMLSGMPVSHASNIEIQDDQVIIYEEPQSKLYIRFEDMGEFDKYVAHEDITKDVVIEAIKSNDNLSSKYKNIALNLLESVTKEYPNYDLRIFYYNIKTLQVEELSQEDFKSNNQNMSGAGAYYSSTENKIVANERVPIEALYHEMYHVFEHFYREYPDKIISRNTDFTALDEAFTDKLSGLVVKQTESYEFNRAILDYLLTTIDYDITDYNVKGPSSLLSTLKEEYPDIDFDYINASLDLNNYYLIHENKYQTIDNMEDFREELFRLCLKQVTLETGYEPFNNFAKIFITSKDSELIFYYLERYNEYLKSLGYQNIINKDKTLNLFKTYYEDYIGVAYIKGEVVPIKDINDYPNFNAKTGINFASKLSASMFENYQNFGTPEYYNKIGVECGLISPHNLYDIPIYLNSSLLINGYPKSLYVQVGTTINNQIGFILTNENNEILYQSNEQINNLSNKVNLDIYISSYSNYIDKLELNNVLNEDYLRIFQKDNNIFNNLVINDKNVEVANIQGVEPPISDNNVNLEYRLEIEHQDFVGGYFLNDISVYTIDNIVYLGNTGINFYYEGENNNTYNLETVLRYNNILNEEQLNYHFTEEELINIVKSYLDLNKKEERGR